MCDVRAITSPREMIIVANYMTQFISEVNRSKQKYDLDVKISQGIETAMMEAKQLEEDCLNAIVEQLFELFEAPKEDSIRFGEGSLPEKCKLCLNKFKNR